MIAAVVIILALAVGFRLRGWEGFERITGRGATTARIVCWAIPVGLASLALGMSWLAALAMGIAAWVGCLPGWWGSLDMGRHEGGFWRDFALHSLRGVLWTAPMAAVLWWFGGAWWSLVVAGAACGLIYEAGYRIAAIARGRMGGGTEIGEALFGAAIGAALALPWVVRAGALSIALAVVVPPAMAHSPGLTAEQNAWLDRQRARDGTKCCDFRDVHIGQAVEWRIAGGLYQVRISGEWHDVPPGRVLQPIPGDPSPFGGEALLFYSLNHTYPLGFSLWCFQPSVLM